MGEIQIPIKRVTKMIKRLYGYLKRFESEGMKLDIFYVMSRIIYNDVSEAHRRRLKEIIKPWVNM